MNCIGLDVHETSVFGAVLREGEVEFRFEVPTQTEALQEVIQRIKGPKRVAVEECNLSDWCKRTLEGFVNEVIICDPRWNRLISEDEHKVDPVDAYRLGLLLWLGQLRPVYHGDLQLQKLKEGVISYWQCNGDLTRAKNRLKSLFARRGLAAQAALRCQDGNALTQTGQLLGQSGGGASAVKRTLSRKISVIAWSIMKDPQPYREEVHLEKKTIR